MDSFGRFFRISIFGESHGKSVGILVDGCPAGISLREKDFTTDMRRRSGGLKGTTTRRESDTPITMSGVFRNRTTGAPIMLFFENRDVDSAPYKTTRDMPRPGHADFVAMRKYGGFNDVRGGGHFSGRLTSGLVAAGVIAKKIIRPVKVRSRLIEIGGSPDAQAALARAIEARDSVGGIVECTADCVPVGLGEPFFDSVESLISHLVFAIPAVKAIEFGAGFEAARMTGSEHNDLITDTNGMTDTNNAGGINGGITNGNEIVFRVAIKPTPTIPKSQRTINFKTGKRTAIEPRGRHDTCIALRAPVIVEAAAAIVLADLMLLEHRVPRVFV